LSVKIDQAFIDATINAGLAIDVVHENGVYSVWSDSAYTDHVGVYKPTNGRPYVKIKQFPAGSAPLTLACSDDHRGMFQAKFKYPADTGAVTTKEKAESLLAVFQIGTPIVYSGQKVFPESKRRDGGRIEGGFYQIVCRVEYRAFTTR